MPPYTLPPTPCHLHPAPCPLHPTPYTLHPTPYTLHPTPYTLHRKLDSRHQTLNINKKQQVISLQVCEALPKLPEADQWRKDHFKSLNRCRAEVPSTMSKLKGNKGQNQNLAHVFIGKIQVTFIKYVLYYIYCIALLTFHQFQGNKKYEAAGRVLFIALKLVKSQKCYIICS